MRKVISRSEWEWNEDNNPALNAGYDYGNIVEDFPVRPVYDKQAKYKDQIDAAKLAAKENGAAKLTGSKKQKDWAEQLRQSALSHIKDEKITEYALKELVKSKFWIENRKTINSAIVKSFNLSNSLEEVNKELSLIIPDGARFEITQEIRILLDKRNLIINEIEALNVI